MKEKNQKIKLAIELLIALNRGDKSRQELAEILEISPRKVVSIIDELREIVNITSTRGLGANYRLDDNLLSVFGYYTLTHEDQKLIHELIVYLEKTKSFLKYPQIVQILQHKILNMDQLSELKELVNYIECDGISDGEKSYIKRVENAIKDQKRISFEYKKLNSLKAQKYLIEPYWIVPVDKEGYYVIGMDVAKKDFRTFKIVRSRMRFLDILNQTFQKDDNQTLDQHIGKLSLVKDNLINVRFKIKGKEAVLMYEKRIGLKDTKQFIDNDVLLVDTIVEGSYTIKKLLLEHVPNVYDIEPVSLRYEIKEALESGLAQFND